MALTLINLLKQVKGILTSANGGTGNGFTKFSGPTTAEKTFTLPDSSQTIETQNNKAAVNGYAGLDATTKVPVAQLPTGTTGTTVCIGNDGRVVGAEQAANKNAANGYAPLDAGTKIPTANLGGAGADATKYLRGDQTWQVINVTVPTFVDGEVPSGTIDGANATFTLAHAPNPAASLALFKNGQRLIAGGTDYTLVTATVTYVAGVIPASGDAHVADYRW